MNNVILFAEDNRGIFIPQHFAESINRDFVTGVDSEQWTILEAGPEHELYWDVWDEVMNGAVVSKDGREYTLYQDGDLFLIDHDNMTPEEKRNMFGSEEYGRDELASVVFDVPAWIDQDVTLGQLESIAQGGCDSGAYMPAVTYAVALATMNDHGDDIMDYIENTLGELPAPSEPVSWKGLAVHFLSIAVELWASQIDEIELVD